MSPELKQFFISIQQWIDDGCPEHEIFNKELALCISVREFGLQHDYPAETIDAMSAELAAMLKHAYGSSLFPFNTVLRNFVAEIENQETYKNPERLAFIRKHSHTSKYFNVITRHPYLADKWIPVTHGSINQIAFTEDEAEMILEDMKKAHPTKEYRIVPAGSKTEIRP